MNPHPATQISFADLSAALHAEVAAGNLQVQVGTGEHAGLEIYSYTRQCYYGKLWNPTTTIARGLVLAPAEQRLVAVPFPKFFNYGETGPLRTMRPFEVTAKMDGSLGIAFHWRGEWHVATKGRLDSSQAQWAEARLRALNTVALDPEITWLFEAIFRDPNSDTVIRYDFENLILLSGFNRWTGEEISPSTRAATAAALGVPVVEILSDVTLEALIEQARVLDEKHEGFVVRFGNGERIKIKGDRYCEIARLILNLEPLSVWEMLLQQHDLAAARIRLPEEFHRDFDQMICLLRAAETALMRELEALAASVAHLSDAELGKQQRELLAPHRTGRFVFQWRKGDFSRRFTGTGDALRRSFFELFRPTGNRLPDYVPSDVVTRFLNSER